MNVWLVHLDRVGWVGWGGVGCRAAARASWGVVLLVVDVSVFCLWCGCVGVLAVVWLCRFSGCGVVVSGPDKRRPAIGHVPALMAQGLYIEIDDV